MTEITPRYLRLADRAVSLAADHSHETIHMHCALVVRKNRIVSIGYNSRRTSPQVKTRMRMWHAESAAMHRCSPKDLKGADLVVVRYRRDGKTGLSRPCKVCLEGIKNLHVKRVFYTTGDPKLPVHIIYL